MERVKNEYGSGQYKEIKIEIDGKAYHVEKKGEKLSIVNSDGEVYYERSIKFSCVAFAFSNNILAYGDYCGTIHCIDLKDEKRFTRWYILPEAEAEFREGIRVYPMLTNLLFYSGKSGYDYLPEILTFNEIISHVAFSTAAAYDRYFVFGDMSGRIVVFDSETCTIENKAQVPGPITKIAITDDKVVVDYLDSDRVPEVPTGLKNFSEAVRVEYEKNILFEL